MIDLHAFRRRYAIRARTHGYPLEVGTSDELAIICNESTDLLRMALRDAGIAISGDQAGDVQILVAEFIAEQLTSAFIASSTAVASFDAFTTLRDVGEGLVVDEDLAQRLPLLPLAASIATVASGGRMLVTSTAHHVGVFSGLFSCYRSAGWSILLDAGLEDGDLGQVFAHEIGHALDQVISSGYRTDRTASEVVAEALVGPLLDHLPATVAEARPLVEAAYAQCAPYRLRSTPRSDALGDVLAWALETVGALCPLPELVAAFTTTESREAI